MTPNHSHLIEKFNRLINKFMRIEKQPRDYGTGTPLYPSEIHLIESVGNMPGINVTQLANTHGISKPAISQKLKKLEEKELIERFKADANEKEVRLKLKIMGEIAFRGHERFHAKVDVELIKIMNSLPQTHIKSFETLLNEVNDYAEALIKER